MQQQKIDEIDSHVGSTGDLSDQQRNRKNYNVRSNRKAKLQEEFKKKELDYFLKIVEEETLKEMESKHQARPEFKTVSISNKTRIAYEKSPGNIQQESDRIELDEVSKIITANLEKD